MQLEIYFKFIFVQIFFITKSNSTIWIKNVKFQSARAAFIGCECLTVMTKHYFSDPDIPRTKNLVMSYTNGMTSPAIEIQQRYLIWLHHSIANGSMER